MIKMKQTCPHAELQIVKNSGHNIHFEKPFDFHVYIYKFLTRTMEKNL